MNSLECFATLLGSIILNTQNQPDLKDVKEAVESDSFVCNNIVETLPYLFKLNPTYTFEFVKELLYSKNLVYAYGHGHKLFSAYAGMNLEAAKILSMEMVHTTNINHQCAGFCLLPGLCYMDKSTTRKLIRLGINQPNQSIHSYISQCFPCLIESDFDFFIEVEAEIKNNVEFSNLYNCYVLTGSPRSYLDSFHQEASKKRVESFWEIFTVDLAYTDRDDAFLFMLPRFYSIYALR